MVKGWSKGFNKGFGATEPVIYKKPPVANSNKSLPPSQANAKKVNST